MVFASALVAGVVVSATLSAGGNATAAARSDAPVQRVEVVNAWPHDRAAFTEGLLFYDGDLLESTGQYGESTLRRVDLRTGKVRQEVDLDRRYFAEGIALLRGRLYQLTWQERRCFVYDPSSLAAETVVPYGGEGWGLTQDGQSLIVSDGTNVLRFLDPQTFEVSRTIRVLDGDRPLVALNELEYVKGEIYANVLFDRRIARIDPRDGALLGWIDLTDILPADEVSDEDAVLNGIAYDELGDRLFVTGKRWPKLFEIRVDERPDTRRRSTVGRVRSSYR